jgi:hypothetical protein
MPSVWTNRVLPDLLGDQPIKQMAPSMSGISEAPSRAFCCNQTSYVECIFGNVDTQHPSMRVLPFRFIPFSTSPASNNLVRRIDASCASLATVQSEQQSLEKRGLIYRTGSFARGRQRLTVLLAARARSRGRAAIEGPYARHGARRRLSLGLWD